MRGIIIPRGTNTEFGIACHNGLSDNFKAMKINELEKAPKLFCENIKMGYSKEYFVIALSSGDQATVYSLTPEHAKRLQLYLAHEIAGFEKEHGEIHATWNPNVVSPVQKLNPPAEGS